MGVKRIEDMIRTKQLGDVSRSDMLSFLHKEGYQESGGKGDHIRLVKIEEGLPHVLTLPGGRVLRKDQARYVLKEGHYL
ncbi:MAG: hypothetical protein WC852_02490 [Candidatus Nanoarchaeia archaeon]|jgi:predicted RNA binding protein YcfA (HicA-like mRNA interferase family)